MAGDCPQMQSGGLAQGGGKEHCDTSADIWEWCWEFTTDLSAHYLRLTR